jgi:hypothetical protein
MLKEQTLLYSLALFVHRRAYLELYQLEVHNRLDLPVCPCSRVL